jgi:hypothetical protein
LIRTLNSSAMKPVGDEAGGPFAGAEARMLHQRREERTLWRMPSMYERVERVACASIAASRVGAQVISLAIIGS